MSSERESILKMAKGAIQERVDYEVAKVIDNICDINTTAKAKRKIVLTIVMTPNEDRTIISASVTAKSTLVPTKPIDTALAITSDANGEMVLVEMSAEIPGQVDMSGHIESSPKIMKLAQQA